MSEFKFACPICGQHITSGSSQSGSEIACPTCFRRLIVPQAPANPDSKLILAAALAGEPKTSRDQAVRNARRAKARVLTRWSLLAVLAAGLLAAGWFGWFWLEKRVGRPGKNPELAEPAPRLEKRVYSFWTADIEKAVLPETPAGGKLRGTVVESCEATLKGGTLMLRTGQMPPLTVSVALFASQPTELSGKSIVIPQNRPSPRPPIEVTWNDGHSNEGKAVYESGYVLKMSLGRPANGKIPGEIYLSLPDEYKSFLAGRFVADLSGPGK